MVHRETDRIFALCPLTGREVGWPEWGEVRPVGTWQVDRGQAEERVAFGARGGKVSDNPMTKPVQPAEFTRLSAFF